MNSPLSNLAKILEQQIQARSDDKLNLYKPHPGQEEFHRSNAKIRVVVCGNRWGKTEASVIELLWLCIGIHPYHPRKVPLKGKLYAETFGHISEYIEPKILKWIGSRHLDANKPFERNQHGHLTGVRFACGSYLKIGCYAQADDRSEGSDWDFIAFDEPPARSLYLANLRGLVDRNGIMWFTMTPLKEPWIYDELWTPGNNGTKPYIWCKNGSSYENPYTSKDGLDIFSSEMSGLEREVRIEGKFKKLSGLVIDTYDPELSDIDPFTLNNEFTVYEGIDPHPAKPHTCIWKAIHKSGYRYIIDELYFEGGMREFGMEIAQHRRNIVEQNTHIIRSVCDTSLNQVDGNFRLNLRNELIDGLRSMGETLFPSNAQKRDWVNPGIQKLRDLYRKTEQKDTPPHTKTNIILQPDVDLVLPKQYVFKSCTTYRSELMHWQWARDFKHENPKAQDFGNDGLDCDRYIESLTPSFQTPGLAMVKHEYYNGAYKRLSRNGTYENQIKT